MCALILKGTAQELTTLEMLDKMLDSFGHPEQSSTEQSRAKASKVVRCSVKCWIRLTRAQKVKIVQYWTFETKESFLLLLYLKFDLSVYKMSCM